MDMLTFATELTPEQRASLVELWVRTKVGKNTVTETLPDFIGRAHRAIGDYVGIMVGELYYGIEKDGYTHT